MGRANTSLESLTGLQYNGIVTTSKDANTPYISNVPLMYKIYGSGSNLFFNGYYRYTVSSDFTTGATYNGDKLILQTSINGGNISIANLYDSDIAAISSWQLMQIIWNFIYENDPTAEIISGAYPYASNIVYLMRYDDYTYGPEASYVDPFVSFYDISHDCTIAAKCQQ
jgi:hypothetical protein